MIDLDALEKLAREATPGPWEIEYGTGDDEGEVYGLRARLGERLIETDTGIYPPRRRDAAFIAAANPSTVLALVARVRELEAIAALFHRATCFRADCALCAHPTKETPDDQG